MGFGQVIDNMNNNYKRMLSPDNILLAFSNFGIRSKIDKLKKLRSEISALKEADIGEAGWATRGVRSLMYVDYFKNVTRKYLAAMKNPSSSRITEDQMDKDREKFSDMYDVYESGQDIYTAGSKPLKCILIQGKSKILSQLDFVIKAATNPSVEPSKTVADAVNLLNEARKKRHSIETSRLADTNKAEQVKTRLEEVERYMDVIMKYKSYVYRLLNQDIGRAVEGIESFLLFVKKGGKNPYTTQEDLDDLSNTRA